MKGKANKVYVAGHSVISETISEYNLLNSHHSFHDNIHGSLYKEQLNQSMDESHIENQSFYINKHFQSDDESSFCSQRRSSRLLKKSQQRQSILNMESENSKKIVNKYK